MKQMKRTVILLTLLLLLCSTPDEHAYTRPRFLIGPDVLQSRWPVTSAIPITVNIDAPNLIQAGSQPFEAVRNAFESRSAYSTITFAPVLGSVPESFADDGISLVTFKDTPANQSASAGFAAVAFFFLNIIDGQPVVTESDIIFNPLFGHTTTGVGGFDIENLGSHEIDHFLSLEHSAVITSTGHPNFGEGDITKRSLDADDIAGTEFLYPFPDFSTRTGTLSGTVTLGAADIFGAQVVALRQSDGEPVSELSVFDGEWRIDGLVPGDYTVYVEAFDGPYFQGMINDGIYSTPFDTVFASTFSGGATPTVYSLSGGATIGGINFSVSGTVRVNGEFWGISPDGIGPIAQTVAVQMTQGTSIFLSVSGSGLGQVPDDGISISGTGVTVSDQNVARGIFLGLPYMIVSVTAAADAPAVPRSILLKPTGQLSAITGGLEILPSEPRPDLLRSDEVTSVSPVMPALATLFPLDPLGADNFPGNGEGTLRALAGSDDDDDLYVPGIRPGFLEPDLAVLTDPSRPLVFYRLSDPSAELALSITAAGRLKIDY